MKNKKYKKHLSLWIAMLVGLSSIPFPARPVLAAKTVEEADERTPIPDDQKTVPECLIPELSELREENVKHFRKYDGTFSAVMYDTAVHYQEDDGSWTEIDNTLHEEPIPEYLASVLKRTEWQTGGEKQLRTEDCLELLEEEDSSEIYLPATENPEDIFENAEDAFVVCANTDIPAFVLASTNGPVSKYFAEESGNGFLFSETYKDTSVAFLTEDTDEWMSQDPAARLSYCGEKKDDPETVWEAADVSYLSTQVRYEDVWEGTDLCYESVSNSIKESILIYESKEVQEYSFLMAAEGLYPELGEDGSIGLFRKDSGEEIFVIAAPYMYDAAGSVSDAVRIFLEEAGEDLYRIRILADEGWIHAPERRFPVTIDPTLELKSGNSENDITSTYVMEGSPDSQQSGYRDLYVGYSSLSSSRRNEIYLHVNNLPQIPEDCIPVAAYLGYYCPITGGWSSPGAITTLNLECHELTPASLPSDYRTWIQSLSWNTKPAYDPAVTDYASLSDSSRDTYVTWNITEAAKKWYREAGDNKGLAIVPAAFDYSATNSAVGKLYGYGSTAPSIFIVNYRNMVGIEDYYSYQTEDVGRAGTVYINDYTDEITLVHEDIVWESVCNAFTLSHIYNSTSPKQFFTSASSAGIHTKDYSSMKTGRGWKLSVQQTIVAGPNGTLIWNDADGTEHYFHVKEGYPNLLEDEDGLGLTIHRTWPDTPSNCEILYTMYDQDRYHSWEFANGYLTAVKDSNGNAVYIAYNNNYNASSLSSWYPVWGSSTNQVRQIVSVPHGSTASVIADLAYTDGSLTSITDYNGRTIGLHYTSGRLTRINYPDGKYAGYTYAAENRRMETAVDKESGYGLEFTHGEGSFGRLGVSRVREYAETASGNVYGSGYSMGKTSEQLAWCRYYGRDHVADEDRAGGEADDIVTYTSFDYGARAINRYEEDPSGRITGVEAASYTATKEPGTEGSASNNRISSAASMGIEGVNLLVDSGIEEGGTGWTFQTDGSGMTGSIYSATASADSDSRARTGDRMLVLKGTAAACSNGRTGRYYQTAVLEGGKTYTLSGCLKTGSMTAGDIPGRGAFLYFADGADAVLASSVSVDYPTKVEISEGWEKYSVTFCPAAGGSYRVGVGMKGASGQVFCDDLQLEENETFSSTNLIGNGSFEQSGLTGWSRDNSTSARTTGTISGIKSSVTGNMPHDGTRSLKLLGGAAVKNRLGQTVKLKCSAQTTFLLSGWAKADASFTPSEEEDKKSKRMFGLTATFSYEDGTS